MSRWSSIPALAFGAFLAIAELVRNWGNWQWWPFWLVDYLAATLLIGAAWLAGRGHPRAPQVLAGAWGFTSAMFYMSFWSHIERFDQPSNANVSQAPLTVIIGMLWMITVVAFAHALFATRPPSAHGSTKSD